MAITKLHATPVIPNQLPKTIIPIVRKTNEIPVPIITILLLSLPKNCASRINAILLGITDKLIILIASTDSMNLGKKFSINIGAINIPKADTKIEKIITKIFTRLLLAPVDSSGSKYLPTYDGHSTFIRDNATAPFRDLYKESI